MGTPPTATALVGVPANRRHFGMPPLSICIQIFYKIMPKFVEKARYMMESKAIKDIREEVKRYIDHADEKVVKMEYAMLEVDADNDWWETMPDGIKKEVEEALSQADKGEVISLAEVKKKHPQWFTK